MSRTQLEGKAWLVTIVRLHSQVSRIGRDVVLAGLLSVPACAAQGVTPPPPPPPVCTPSTAPLPPSDATVTIDVSRKYQTIQGFGTTERLFDDPHVTKTFNPATQRAGVVIPPDQQAAILQSLFGDLGLTRVRYATDPGVEPVNDNTDPNITDLSKFDFTWKHADGHISFVNAARPYGLKEWWGSPITPGESWMSATDPAEYAEWALAIIRHWNNAGTPLTYWSIFNEPGYFGGSTTRSGAYMRDAVKLIGGHLAAEGIPTRIVIPDDVNPASALSRASVILADPVARLYVAAVATHLYDATFPPAQPNTASLTALAGLAAQYGLPLWMSEWYNTDWFTWAKTMHSMLNDFNASAVDYAWGFFGQWDIAQLIVVQYSGNSYTGFSRNKQSWVTEQYAAFVRPGTVRVSADAGGDPSLLASAYFDGTKVVLVALNTGASSKAVRFELGAGIPCVTSLTGTRTSASENGVALPSATLAAPHFVTSLPAMSITTLVAQ